MFISENIPALYKSAKLKLEKTDDFAVQYFGRVLHWTFEAIQRDLLADAQIHEAAATLGELGGGTLTGPDGDVTEFNAATAKRHRAKAKDLRAAMAKATG